MQGYCVDTLNIRHDLIRNYPGIIIIKQLCVGSVIVKLFLFPLSIQFRNVIQKKIEQKTILLEFSGMYDTIHL